LPTQRRIDPTRDAGRVRQRLMRKGKGELADRVLALEQGGAVQGEQWLRLNDDLLLWRLRAEKAEAQLEKMRRALDTKDAQVRDLQQKLDDLNTAWSGAPDTEVGRALQEALKRAHKSEALAGDLRLRLFAKNVVRTRDKVRHLDKKGAAKLHRLTE
jgi:Xaa-Pro aminopeptidase